MHKIELLQTLLNVVYSIRLAANGRRNQKLQSIKRLELHKQQDILAVLTASQTQRLLAFEQNSK
ncbi:hypothetical protein [Dyadobacter sp. 32]|uniref:hypothetical protein n=1 Tax=Dyadobacter sp. 32 TaxID=538966 RepID=UPI0011EF4E31